ncbi:MAG: response regulator [Candidatus Hydrothermia bacterium]
MPIRVLLVDDEEDILWGLSEELSRNKIEVDTATNGLEALEKIKKKQYDFLVTDIRMPGLSGSELLIETKKIQPDIKVIVMTAYGSDEVKQDVLTKGAISYLEKPFDFDQILNVIMEKQVAGEEETLRNLTLQQFLQLVSMEGKSCEIVVNTSEGEGKIFFEEGEVINASIGKLRGEEAFSRILKEPESSFKVKWGSPKVKREIEKPFHALLLSAAVQKDEEVAFKEELGGFDLESLSELFKDEGVQEEVEAVPAEEESTLEPYTAPVEEEIEVPLEESVEEKIEEKIEEEKEQPSVTLEEVEKLLEGISERVEEAPAAPEPEFKAEEVIEKPAEEEVIIREVKPSEKELKAVEEIKPAAPAPSHVKLSQELKEKFTGVVKEISDILALLVVDSDGNIVSSSERVSTGVPQVIKIWAPALKNIVQSAGKTSIGSIKDITLTSDKYHLLITDAKNGSMLIVAVIPVKSMKIALVKIKIKELITEIAKVV